MSSEPTQAFRLDGRVAIVTGGAGWVGSAVSAVLAEAGAHVVIAGRTTTAGLGLADQLIDRGLKASFIQYDQGSEASVDRLVQQTLAVNERIDVLINNAASWPMESRDSRVGEFRESMAINAVGLFGLTRSVARVMSGLGGGSIVTIGSIFGLVGPDRTTWVPDDPSVGLPDYFFHKGGSLQLTRWIAGAFAREGVRANYIALGPIDKPRPGRSVDVDRLVERIPLGRLGRQRDITGPVLFLSTDSSSFVTGACLTVDGGYTAI